MDSQKDFSITPKYLLNNKFRLISLLFLIIGLALLIVRFYFGNKLGFFDWTVFAIADQFLFNSKFFTFVQNNVLEELTGTSFLIAIYIGALTQEKIEKESYIKMRLESIFLTFWLNFAINIAGMFLFFGFSYIWFLLINLYSIPLIYFCTFKIKVFQSKQLH